jgi:hypothetical protein
MVIGQLHIICWLFSIIGIKARLDSKLLHKGGKNRRAREHCSQEMLNSCRKFIWMKICYWKCEGNLNTHVPLWAQQHMVDRHYSLNWSARTLYVYAHADLAQEYSVGLQEIFVSRLCSQEGNSFFLPWLLPCVNGFLVWWLNYGQDSLISLYNTISAYYIFIRHC